MAECCSSAFVVGQLNEVFVEADREVGETFSDSHCPGNMPKTLSPDMIAATKKEILEDPSISKTIMEWIHPLDVEQIHLLMLWLNSCLVNNRGLRPKAVEVVWENFHRHLRQQLGLSYVTCRSGFSFFSLKLMQRLVRFNYREQPQTKADEEGIDARDKDILTYIGGYILRRFINHSGIDNLIDKHSPATGMIQLFDRGGLLVPQDGFVKVLLNLEFGFRSLAVVSVDKDEFFNYLDDKRTFCFFQELLPVSAISYDVQEALFMNIANLFFKVRAHQKCRQIFEKSLQNASKSRKSKALRDVLSRS